MRRSAATAFLFITPLVACGGLDRNPVEPEAQPKAPTAVASPVAPVPAQSPTPAPPAPVPEPTPTPEPNNRPPRVSLSFDGPSSCHPRRLLDGTVVSCLVELIAEAKDPDGDPITYAWSGCTRGTGTASGCIIDAPGTFAATVEVRDSRGATARASLNAQGTNGPPSASFNITNPPYRVGRPVEIYGAVHDPDDGNVCGRQWCVRAEASGACGPSAYLDCPCLGDLYAEVRPHSIGTCTVTVTLRDDWGLEGKSVLRIEVNE